MQRDCITVNIRPSEALYFALTHSADVGKQGGVLELLEKIRDDSLAFGFGEEP